MNKPVLLKLGQNYYSINPKHVESIRTFDENDSPYQIAPVDSVKSVIISMKSGKDILLENANIFAVLKQFIQPNSIDIPNLPDVSNS